MQQIVSTTDRSVQAIPTCAATTDYWLEALQAVHATIDAMDQQCLWSHDRRRLVEDLRVRYPQYSFWLETLNDFPVVRVCTKGLQDLFQVRGQVQIPSEDW